jgi:NADPH:quinone reductase-like Zn-dependent oxidoreductase
MIARMQAWSLKAFGFDHLTLEDRPQPACGPGQVLLRMRAASLNYRDVLIARGEYNPKLRLPLVPCSDGLGEVVELGAGTRDLAVGDRVCPIFARGWWAGPPTRGTPQAGLGGPLDGTLSEYIVADAGDVVRAPGHLSDVQAATLACAGVTAWQALFEEGNVLPGQTVLVLGTGGVSLFALQFAKLAGARVIVTSRSRDKLERALALGADEGLDLSSDPRFGLRARELSGGAGVDHVIEVGGAGTLAESLRAVRAGGTISLIGVVAGGAQPSLVPAVMRNIRLQGVLVGPRASFEAMNRAIESARLEPVVDRTFAFSDVRAAFEHLVGGQHFGKIAIAV